MTTRTYYAILPGPHCGSEFGEILQRCTATSARQARRIMGIRDDGPEVICYPASRLSPDAYDPKLLATDDLATARRRFEKKYGPTF